ncbi:MAG: hypothetical protein ACLP7Q_19295 [Isosphaeraceae bacterium]
MVGYFSKNLVGIAATQIYGDPPQENTFFIAGCIISIKQRWFFVTAGHCIEELEAAFQHTRIERVRLVDYSGTQSIDKHPIPFDYKNSLRRYAHESNGADYGFIYLAPYYCRLLQANGVKAHDEVQLFRQPDEFETARMLGFPSALVRKQDPSTYLFSASMIPLTILKETPEQVVKDSPSNMSDNDRKFRDAMFYATILRDLLLPKNEDGEDDIKGMSGGPILGFKRTEEGVKYWVAAIQCSWYSDSRLICAVPLPIIGHIIVDLCQRNFEEYQENDAEEDRKSP